MMGASYKTKKDLKAAVGQPLRYEETSFFGPEKRIKKEKAVLHTVSWRYSDSDQFYNEGVLMTPRQAKRLEKKLQTRVDEQVIEDLVVSEDAKPIGFIEMLDSIANNYSLQWDHYPEVDN